MLFRSHIPEHATAKLSSRSFQNVGPSLIRKYGIRRSYRGISPKEAFAWLTGSTGIVQQALLARLALNPKTYVAVKLTPRSAIPNAQMAVVRASAN